MKQEWEKKAQKENTRCGKAGRERATAERKIKAKRSFWQWTEPPLKQTAGEELSVGFLTETAEREKYLLCFTFWSFSQQGSLKHGYKTEKKRLDVMGSGWGKAEKFHYFSSYYNISNVNGSDYS